MAREKTRTDTPLALPQVLAEEFAALHDRLPPGYEPLRDETAPEHDKEPGSRPAPSREANEDLISRIYDAIHALPQRRSALCLSGGGIRSATFALGVLQGLARAGLLDKFDYLSTVSGGGYIGSWLSAWIHRHREGLAGVVAELARPAASKLEPEPAPVRYLRTFSNYLSPKLGLFSADSWSLAATVLRNMILNWLVLIPLIASVLMIPRFAVAALAPMSGWAVYLALVVGALCGTASIAYAVLDLPSAGDRRWPQRVFLWFCLTPLVLSAVFLSLFWAWHRDAGGPLPPWWTFALFGAAFHLVGWGAGCVKRRGGPELVEWGAVPLTGFVGGCLVWLAARSLFAEPAQAARLYVWLAAPLLLTMFLLGTTLYIGVASRITDEEDREWWSRSGAWVLIAIVVWLVAGWLVLYGTAVLRELPKGVQAGGGLVGLLSGVLSALAGYSNMTGRGERVHEPSTISGFVKRAWPKLAATVFLLVLLAAISLGTGMMLSIETGWAWLDQSEPTRLGVVFLLLLGVSLMLGFPIDINKFSLHSMYGNRVVRAYMGASRSDRRPHPFTGFDPQDNLSFHELKQRRPFHVVNIALNLVRGENLAWQQRKAESFTATRLHCGAWRIGYRPSARYGGGNGTSLGKAVVISGAAASPNMGYHSSPPVTFLMTLFNARLGWWLGNPARGSYCRPGPEFAVGPMIAEALGLTDDKSPYVYLSDGGHYENLGLYEMVLRRCRIILVSDASCDPTCTFEDLGNAIRKIRIDLGVPIEFSGEIPIFSRRERRAGKVCAIAKIGYSRVDGDGTDGVLVYLKPAFYGDEPADVFNYAHANSEFPHEPTSDQWFSESQFESYRMLGLCTVQRICGPQWKGEGLEDFEKAVRDYLAR